MYVLYLAYYEDDEYYDGTEEWCGDDCDGYPEGNGVSDHEIELEGNDGDGGSGKVDERFLIDAFLKASGTCNIIGRDSFNRPSQTNTVKSHARYSAFRLYGPRFCQTKQLTI